MYSNKYCNKEIQLFPKDSNIVMDCNIYCEPASFIVNVQDLL